MTVGIYGLFDSETDECLYVGLSLDIEYRVKKHVSKLRARTHQRADFIQWWVEHGEDESSIEIKILEACEESNLNRKESYWFIELKPKFYGKEPSENEKWKHSEETKKKISKSLKISKGGSLEDIDRMCPGCKNTFRSRRRNVKFCSISCVSKNSLEKRSSYSNKALELHEEGFSLREIAKEIGKSHVTVKNIIDFSRGIHEN